MLLPRKPDRLQVPQAQVVQPAAHWWIVLDARQGSTATLAASVLHLSLQPLRQELVTARHYLLAKTKYDSLTSRLRYSCKTKSMGHRH